MSVEIIDPNSSMYKDNKTGSKWIPVAGEAPQDDYMFPW